MTKSLFAVSGNKIASLLIGENSLMFSSQSFDSPTSFMESWNKKLSLATKIEIKYEAIKSAQKEDNDEDVIIKYKAALGMPGTCQFSFTNTSEHEQLFTFLENEKHFGKTYAEMTPFKAVSNYIIGLLATVALTVFSYLEALKIANGIAEPGSSAKSRSFYALVEFLGDKGVLAVGGLLACYLLYKIWTRFSSPPHQIVLLPPAVQAMQSAAS